ncbi:HNH endonuclease signature motif containing protein [Pseudomonas sp. LY10J]|uniref:HNH endonuclease signature motif containing protein n=1 Tax=Pseudomonas TaxID=286 RepID=UPI003B63D347
MDAWVNTVGVPVPASVAERLRGRSFASFDSFRRAFWREVGREQGLISNWATRNQDFVRKGNAPQVRKEERRGRRVAYEIHHVKQISEGGEVYDLDNLVVLTPNAHIKQHNK